MKVQQLFFQFYRNLLITTDSDYLLITTDSDYLLITTDSDYLLITTGSDYLLITTDSDYLLITTDSDYLLITTGSDYLLITTDSDYLSYTSWMSVVDCWPTHCQLQSVGGMAGRKLGHFINSTCNSTEYNITTFFQYVHVSISICRLPGRSKTR